MGVYIFLAVLAALVIFVGILLIRTALAAKKAEPIGEKPVYTTEREDTENGERLMKMIECQTVSSREIYDDTEFSKLRAAVISAKSGVFVSTVPRPQSFPPSISPNFA